MSEGEQTPSATVEHLIACILEADYYDNNADTSTVNITRESGKVFAHMRGLTIRGAQCETVEEAVRSLYAACVERAHKDHRRARGLLTRLDADPKASE